VPRARDRDGRNTAASPHGIATAGQRSDPPDGTRTVFLRPVHPAMPTPWRAGIGAPP